LQGIKYLNTFLSMVEQTNIPELRFTEFDGDWQRKKLGEISRWYSGGTPSKKEERYWNGNIPWISASSMRGSEYSDSGLKITGEGLKSGSRLAKKGSLLMLVRGSMLFNKIPIGIAMKDLAYNQDVKAIEINTSSTSKFILYYLNSKENWILSIVTGTGIGAGKLDLCDLKEFDVSLPSLPEQQKITSFFTVLDKKITQLKRKKELLEQYKKGVMQKLLSQELRFKDENGEEFPDWEKKKLGDSCDCLDNLRKPLNAEIRQKIQGEIPYWGANNIMDYINDYLFDETIILLAEDGGNFNEFKTRPIANISHGKCWVNNHTHVLRGKSNLINEFLYYSLVHKNITEYVSGGTRAKLTKGEMLKIRISIPCLSEQNRVAKFLTFIDKKLDSASTQIDQSERYKKGLLQKMFC